MMVFHVKLAQSMLLGEYAVGISCLNEGQFFFNPIIILLAKDINPYYY